MKENKNLPSTEQTAQLSTLQDLLKVNPEEYIYSFRDKGRLVIGISWPGAKAVAHYFGINIEDVDVKETSDGYFAKAKVEWQSRRSFGAAYQPKIMKTRDGREVPDDKVYVKAFNKAQRNAILNLLPVPKITVKEVAGIGKTEEEQKPKGEIPEEEMPAYYEIPSDDGKTTYTIKQLPDGRWECSCPSFRLGGRECKHIKRIKEGK